ncbi:MAG: hypothetical protein SFY92_00420 [Verrucomicrobiae bacterium]|nr:hypothetical protein [Verrucomicrobiae bacterium]
MADEIKLDELMNFQIVPEWTKEDAAGRVTEIVGEVNERVGGRGRSESRERRGPRSGGGPGHGERRGPAREGGGFGGRGERREGGGRPAGGPRRDDRGGFGGGRREGRGNDRAGGFAPRREFVPRPAPVERVAVAVSFHPLESGLQSIIKQVKSSAKAFPLFQIAKIFLDKPERHQVLFRPAAPEKPVELFRSIRDDAIFLRESDAFEHLWTLCRDEFYDMKKVQGEAPKGNFTAVARCRASGVLIAPPNHHSYQLKLIAHYEERFSRQMSFERFKADIEVVRDEELLKKWAEEVSLKTEYATKGEGEPVSLAGLEEAREHFRANHLPGLIQRGFEFMVPGTGAMKITHPGLRLVLRETFEQEFEFPINFVNVIRPQLNHHGLHIFKARKGATMVNGVKPRYFDLDHTAVSTNVGHILQLLRQNQNMSLKALVHQIAVPANPLRNDALAIAATAYFEPKPVKSAKSVHEVKHYNGALAKVATEYYVPTPGAAAPSPEALLENAVLNDLNWLVREGYVIEFYNGRLELGKMRPPQPQNPGKGGVPVPSEAEESTVDESAERMTP